MGLLSSGLGDLIIPYLRRLGAVGTFIRAAGTSKMTGTTAHITYHYPLLPEN
jgi:hypothetical protein